MDVRDLSRTDLGMLYASVDPHRKLFVSIVFGAIIHERGLDIQIHREPGYVIVMIETAGDVIVAEHRLPVAWPDIDEDVRLVLIRFHLDDVLAGHERWCCRTGLRRGRLVGSGERLTTRTRRRLESRLQRRYR